MNVAYRVVSSAAIVMLAGCQHASAKPAAIAATPSRFAMDSAEIDRLCLHPDSVRAGNADCVLKDQGVRMERKLPSPSAPPR